MAILEVRSAKGGDGEEGGESDFNNIKINWKSNSSNCSYLKRANHNERVRRRRIHIKRGDENADSSRNDHDNISSGVIGNGTSFEGGKEPIPFEAEWTRGSRSCENICGTRGKGRNNNPSLNEPDNEEKDDDYLNSIFHQQKTFSGSTAALVRNSKSCNHPLPSSTSFSNSSTTSFTTKTISPSSCWLLFLLVFSWNLSSTSSFCPPYCSCDDIALSVDCHHSASNLRVVPIFLNPQIKFLSLSKNQIKDITMSLQFYSELQMLDISHNKLESLGKTNFDSLKRLHNLNVSYNAIKSLENGVFTGLTHLRKLDISGNQLEKLEREIFWGLSSVKEIILDRNRMEFIDWDLFYGLDALEKISAKFNFVQVIEPSSSFSLSSGGSAAAISAELHKNTNIINNNNNSSGTTGERGEIPAFWTLKNVHYLDISSNQLTRVKDFGLAMFGSLKELNLCCNYIHTLEEKAFYLSGSPTLGKTSKSSSGSSSGGHLERLNLSQNRLGRVPTEALEKLGSTLRQLDLSSNRISDHISKNAFRALVHLESVRLSDNQEILYIDQDALSENINLINFEADYLSNLTEISPILLRNKMFLENFSLKYASISSLSPEFFQPPVSDIVRCLDLTGNPIDCNCSSHSFYQFVAQNLGEEHVDNADSFDSMYDFEHTMGGGGGIVASRDENNNVIQQHAFHTSNPSTSDDQVEGKSNFSTDSKSESLLASHSNPNLISPQSTPSRSSSSSNNKKKSNLSKNSRNARTRPNLLYVRCQSPPNLGGVLVKDLKSEDFQHCFVADDQVQVMVICIAGGILSLIFLTLVIKLCCACGASRRLSTFCKAHCSTTNCCHKLTKSRKEKKQSSSDKLFFDSMTIALRRDLGVTLGNGNASGAPPPPNFTSNVNVGVPNGKSILGGELLFCGNGNGIPLTTSGCIIGGRSATLGRNGNGNHPITMSMDYDDCYNDEEDDDDDEEESTEQQQHQIPHHSHHHRHPHLSQQQHYGQLERSYAPIEPPPPIPTTPIPLQFSNQVQSLSRKQQKQLLLQQHHLHGHQHHSPTMGYSPKHYAQHNIHNHHHSHHHLSSQHSSPSKHSQQQQQQQQQQNPPVIVHYEYPDFPSMHRVKQVPSVLV